MKKRTLKLNAWQIAFIEHAVRQSLETVEKELHTQCYVESVKELLTLIEES